MTAPPPNLPEALEVWVFEPEPQGWEDVLRRAEAGGWSDVLGWARLRRRPTRLSRRTLIAAAALLGIAGPALGLVASTQTLGRADTAPGPRLTALLMAPEGGSGTFTASLPGTVIAHRGRRGLFVPTRIAQPGPDTHTPLSPLVWRLELRGVPEPVESVRLLERDGDVLATLCEPSFFGNTTTDAHSTLRSLRTGRTTCKPGSDTAAYWVPTLLQDGREGTAGEGSDLLRPPRLSHDDSAHDPVPDLHRGGRRIGLRRPALGTRGLHQRLGSTRARTTRGRVLPRPPLQRAPVIGCRRRGRADRALGTVPRGPAARVVSAP